MEFSVEKNGEINYRVMFGRIWIRSTRTKRLGEKLASILQKEAESVALVELIAAHLSEGTAPVKLWHLAAGNVIAAKSRSLTEQERAVDLLWDRAKLIGDS